MKNKPLFFISALLILFILGYVSARIGENSAERSSSEHDSSESAPAAAEYHLLSQEAAKELMDGEEPYILLDVRTEEEYEERHIKGAILIPHTEVAGRAEEELPDKGALIFVYCRSGIRSKTASNALVSLGYTNVWDIGGIDSWPYGTELV